MSRAGGQPVVKQKAGNNIYTVLSLIAFLSLSVGVGVLWWKNVEITHNEQDPKRSWTNPMFLLPQESPVPQQQ